jgi:peptidoglycan/LPS O-acetylase OafA/YrhL
MNPENPHKQHYPALDGLRGTAILLIVLYHNFKPIDTPGSDLLTFLGWISVDLFFALSGFLITDILLKTAGRKDFLRNFYVRRILRIFPLYYLSLILFLYIVPWLHLHFDVKYYSDNQAWLWGYLQNWLFVVKAQDQTNSLNHFWTLAVEEQFYLLWPLVILLFRKPKYLLIFISTLFVIVPMLRLWVWNKHFPGLHYFNLFTFTRIDSICIGCIIALMQRVNREFLKRFTLPLIIFFSAVNIIFYLYNRHHQFTFPHLALVGYSSIAVMFGLVVNAAISGKTKLINLVFNTRILKFFGKISYGFYIFHWPVYLLLYPDLIVWMNGMAIGWLSEFVVSLLVSMAAIAISWLSFKYYESFFLKLKDKFA